MTIRTNQGPDAARQMAFARGAKRVYTRAVFYVRDQFGDRTDERDYVFVGMVR